MSNGTPTYSPLTLVKMRNGDKHGTFTSDGHEVTVSARTTVGGKTVHVRACSPTHPNLTPVLDTVGMLIKVSPGRYEVRSVGATKGYVDRGTVADLAERLARYAMEA